MNNYFHIQNVNADVCFKLPLVPTTTIVNFGKDLIIHWHFDVIP